MLGSPRVITNSRGNVTSRRDFQPFGEELFPDGARRTSALKYGSSDGIRQKFTTYHRDDETLLDFAEARMYENRHARFTAVDPLLASGKSANPQTFNRYVYVLNNPLAYTDPDGQQIATTGKKWFMPITPDGERTYVYGDTAPKDYIEVTGRNRKGDLVGPFVGSPMGRYPTGNPDYVIKFNPNGPYNSSFMPQTVDVNTGRKSDLPLTEYERNGWEIIQSDWYLMNNPATGAVQNAIEPHDVAFALTPFKFSVIGKGPKPSLDLVKGLDETFNQALANEAKGATENLLGYEIHGTKGLVGDTFTRNVLLISRDQSGRSLQGFRQLVTAMESEASQSGARQLSIIGHATYNNGFLNRNIANRFGYTFTQVNNDTVHLIKNVKP